MEVLIALTGTVALVATTYYLVTVEKKEEKKGRDPRTGRFIKAT